MTGAARDDHDNLENQVALLKHQVLQGASDSELLSHIASLAESKADLESLLQVQADELSLLRQPASEVSTTASKPVNGVTDGIDAVVPGSREADSLIAVNAVSNDSSDTIQIVDSQSLLVLEGKLRSVEHALATAHANAEAEALLARDALAIVTDQIKPLELRVLELEGNALHAEEYADGLKQQLVAAENSLRALETPVRLRSVRHMIHFRSENILLVTNLMAIQVNLEIASQSGVTKSICYAEYSKHNGPLHRVQWCWEYPEAFVIHKFCFTGIRCIEEYL